MGTAISQLEMMNELAKDMKMVGEAKMAILATCNMHKKPKKEGDLETVIKIYQNLLRDT